VQGRADRIRGRSDGGRDAGGLHHSVQIAGSPTARLKAWQSDLYGVSAQRFILFVEVAVYAWFAILVQEKLRARLSDRIVRMT
jgi:hypothetical protein